jgi:hypothetical protein
MKVDPVRIVAAVAAASVTLTLLKVVVSLGEPHPDEWLARQTCRTQGSVDARHGCEQQLLAAGRRNLVAGR